MAGKKQKKKRRANRIEKFLQNRLALPATIILSTVLVAALGYITYHDQAEENRVLDSIDQLGKQSESVKANSQLLAVGKDGWFMNPANPAEVRAIFRKLKENSAQGKLDFQLFSTSLNWLSQALDTLSLQKNQMDDAVTLEADQIARAHQQSISDIYQRQMELIRRLKDMIDSWENETPVTRSQELISIEEQILQESALTRNVSAESHQLAEAQKKETGQFGEKLTRLQESKHQLQVRKNFAILGIIIGITWLAGLIMGARKYYSNSMIR
jgi:hypothetical protein